MKVESCTGLNKCSKKNVGRKLESLLERCNFEGRIEEDPQSKVSLVSCERGAADISVVSDKVNLDNTNYRVHANGKVEKSVQSLQADEFPEVSILVYCLSLTDSDPGDVLSRHRGEWPGLRDPGLIPLRGAADVHQ